jgi:glycine betaine/proline transport system ATP-binding protein
MNSTQESLIDSDKHNQAEAIAKAKNSHPPIECRNLWKIYGSRGNEAMAAIKTEGLSKEEVLDRFGCMVGVVNATFNVNHAEIFCIMGLSGSGKSTLIRHINRLIEPTAGQILIGGQDIGRLTQKELRQLRSDKIGMVFQNMALLPHRTVRSNVAFGLELRKVDKKEASQAAEHVLDLVGLSEWGNYLPEELSGGMQQRVGLARALASDPDILLMDEPFSALDPLIRRQLQDEFIKLSQVARKTTLFITHDLDEAIRLGDQIAIMKAGELVQIGTPEDIVINPIDDYVKEFVAGISRLKIVYAATVMEPIEEYKLNNPEQELEALPTAPPDAFLDHLIDLFVESGMHINIVEDGKSLGVVTRTNLLRGIQG